MKNTDIREAQMLAEIINQDRFEGTMPSSHDLVRLTCQEELHAKLNEQEILDASPIRSCVLCDEQYHEDDMYNESTCVDCNTFTTELFEDEE